MILVVNEDPLILELAQKVLNRDRKVFLASDSESALALAETLGFSVAIVDLKMRRSDGLSLIRKLHETVPQISIIAICGEVQLRESLKALGVVEFLTAPVTPDWKRIVERVRAMRFQN